MKHRSIGILIVLAASLAAIPQASQELASVRDAVGQRARVELRNAFLALQSPGRPSAAPAAAPSTVASCETPREETASPSAKTPAAKTVDARRAAGEQTARAEVAETALIIGDPSQDPQVKVAFNPSEKASVQSAARAVRAVAEAHRTGELAMFVAPGDEFEVDVEALSRVAPQLEHVRGELLRRGEIAGLQEQAARDSARRTELARRDQRQAERAREEVRRRTQPGASVRGGAEVKSAEQFMKVFKFKPTDKTAPAAPVALNARHGLPLYVPAPAPAAESE